MPPFEVTGEEVEGCLAERGEVPALCRAGFVRRAPREPCLRSMVGPGRARERQSLAPLAVQTAAARSRAMPRRRRDTPGHAARMLQPDHQPGAQERGAPAGVSLGDESGWVKKGQDAGGVARPYGGPLGQGAPGQGGGGAA